MVPAVTQSTGENDLPHLSIVHLLVLFLLDGGDGCRGGGGCCGSSGSDGSGGSLSEVSRTSGASGVRRVTADMKDTAYISCVYV